MLRAPRKYPTTRLRLRSTHDTVLQTHITRQGCLCSQPSRLAALQGTAGSPATSGLASQLPRKSTGSAVPPPTALSNPCNMYGLQVWADLQCSAHSFAQRALHLSRCSYRRTGILHHSCQSNLTPTGSNGTCIAAPLPPSTIFCRFQCNS